MAALGADVPFSAVALTASTAQTVVGIKAPTNQAVKVTEIKITFDGATSTAVPALVEIGTCTFGANAPGTSSSSVTPKKRDGGRQETVQTTAAKTWTSEPTTITVVDQMYEGQFNGLYHYIVPLASPIIVPGGGGFVVRITPSANVNCSGKLSFEE